MATLAELRTQAEAAQAEYERGHDRLFRDAERRQRIYSDEEHERRVLALRRTRSEALDEVIEEARQVVAAAEREVAAFEGGADPTALLDHEELAVASARRGFVSDDVWSLPEDQLANKLRTVLARGDRPSIFVYWRAALGRFDALGRPVDLREILDEMRDAAAGPVRLARVERARATIEEAADVQMLAGNLKSGATTAAGAWMNRRFGVA